MVPTGVHSLPPSSQSIGPQQSWDENVPESKTTKAQHENKIKIKNEKRLIPMFLRESQTTGGCNLSDFYPQIQAYGYCGFLWGWGV